MWPSWRRRDTDIDRLDAAVTSRFREGRRLADLDEAGFLRAHARIASLLAPTTEPRFGALRRLPYAMAAVVGGGGGWAALFGVAAAHKIAAVGLATAVLAGGGLAADAVGIGPSVLETIGVQDHDETPPAAAASAADEHRENPAETDDDDADLTGGGQGTDNAQTPDDTHGDDVSGVAKENVGDSNAAEGDGANHGQDVSDAAKDNGGNDGTPAADGRGQGSGQGQDRGRGPDDAPGQVDGPGQGRAQDGGQAAAQDHGQTCKGGKRGGPSQSNAGQGNSGQGRGNAGGQGNDRGNSVGPPSGDDTPGAQGRPRGQDSGADANDQGLTIIDGGSGSNGSGTGSQLPEPPCNFQGGEDGGSE